MQTQFLRTPVALATGLLLFLVVAGVAAIVSLNGGVFTYTLDDPYIHLALADHIWHGHYGINASEYSAPSSSMLWPFILAVLPNSAYTPLLLNTVCAVGTVLVFDKVVARSLPAEVIARQGFLIGMLLMLLVFGTNLPGLVFTGMEHSLQVLLVAVISYGLIVENAERSVPGWLLLAIFLAPLVRYEDLAVSGAALVYLMARGHYKPALLVAACIALLVAAFSAWLVYLGLGPVPSSILVKSAVVSGSALSELRANFDLNWTSDSGRYLQHGLAAMFAMVFLLWSQRHKWLLALAAALAVCGHLLAGRYGWFNRYEIYILTFMLLLLTHLFLRAESAIAAADVANRRMQGAFVLLLAFLFFHSGKYLADLSRVPLAANNVYEQQYQLRRFAQAFYRQPVAVNDLGLVAWGNANYVLDLWGLGSLEALRHRGKDPSPEWMDMLARKHKARLAMIYEHWFRPLPQGWIKVGELSLGRSPVTAAGETVAFYVTDPASKQQVKAQLQAFKATLPAGVEFNFAE